MKDETASQDNTDQQRERLVYQYLLSFTDLGLGENNSIRTLIDPDHEGIEEKHKKLPNESLIANQWNIENKPGINRVYVRRVLRRVYEGTLYEKGKESWPGLSMAKLVVILSSLEKYWQNPASKHKWNPPKVTHSVKLKALQMFSELSPKERKLLNFATPSGEGLIRSLYEDVLNPSYKFGYEGLTKIYQQYLISKTTYFSEDIENIENISDNKSKINKILNKHLSDLTNISPDEVDKEPLKGLREKVLREINRIEFQSGVEQLKSITHSFVDSKQFASINRKMFARHLSKCIIENEEITDEFPVSIKFFRIEKVRPLPLLIYHKNDNPKGLINSTLLSGDKIRIDGLERQYTYRLGIHFSIRDKKSKKILIEFAEEITGIGSPISHAIVAIDRVLMWDIPCLQKYSPIARQQFSNDEVIGGNQNSSIWSHCVVQLYKKDDVKLAISDGKKIEEIDENSTSHHGEYCGFDILETSAKSALYARLRAIRHVLQKNNITSDEYIEQLCYRVNEYNNLSFAKNLLKYYPFSLGVMEATINKTIFLDSKNNKKYRYRDRNNSQDFRDIKDRKCWSSVAYNAHLEITEALLKEGRTVAAKKYLTALRNHTNCLSALMLARYYVCYSQYHFLSDLDSSDNDNRDRTTAISMAEECLTEAEKSLSNKLKECELLGELSHSNTHPFFKIYSQIFMVRARLNLYFGAYISPKNSGMWSKAKAPLIEAEKARIYSARDGNASLYFSQSCFEAWVYLILAFTWDFEKDPKDKEGFSKESCIDWATRLLTHAIVCYEENGLRCYAEIKRNAGFLVGRDNPYVDSIEMQGIPFIQEKSPAVTQIGRKFIAKEEIKFDRLMLKIASMLDGIGTLSLLKITSENSSNNNQSKILPLDLNLFKTVEANINKKGPPRPILFGTDSSNVMFLDGMIELCKSPETSEDISLVKNILSALRKFVIAWSTSRDGAYLEQGSEKCIVKEIFDELPDGCSENNTDFLKKIDKDNDRYIRGFYPHRISKTAIFSKLFIGVCLLIINCRKEEAKASGFNSNIEWEEICNFVSVEGLHETDIPEKVEIELEQKRFNGHLAEHVLLIAEYFKNFRNWTETSQYKSLHFVEIRDKVLKDIFTLIKGENVKL